MDYGKDLLHVQYEPEVYMMRYLANLRLGTPTHIYIYIYLRMNSVKTPSAHYNSYN